MASIIASTFTYFLGLPIELRKMVWEEAAADLPVLNIQRFTAEITCNQQSTEIDGQPRSLLCFTPHADYINLTAGHRMLLIACQESRKAVLRQVDCLLPIHYLATDAAGSLVPRKASVPFNRSGHFCIGGLACASMDACYSRGARGPVIKHHHSLSQMMAAIQGLEELTTSPIENLTIALEPVRLESLTIALDPVRLENPHSYMQGYMHGYMHGWNDDAFNHLALQLPNLKTVSLLGEGALDRRHQIDHNRFKIMHKGATVLPQDQGPLGRRTVPWGALWQQWKRQQCLYYAITLKRLCEIQRCRSQNQDGSESGDDAANAALRRELEQELSAVMGFS